MILDFYDDPAGSVLRSKVAYEDLPDFIKTAAHIEKVADRLPDDVFALVAIDGGRKMRKYACVDKGNTALSVIYFLENHDRLPVEAQKVAAANLLTACSWYELEPPVQLKLAAYGAVLGVPLAAGGLAGAGVGSLAAGKGARGKGAVRGGLAGMLGSVPAAIAGAHVGGALGHDTGSVLGGALIGSIVGGALGGGVAGLTAREKTAGIGGLLNAGMGAMTMHGAVKEGLERHNQQMQKMKVGDVAGSDIQPFQKTAALRPHVDVTGQRPPARLVKAAASRYCLVKEGSAKFPIDTYGQVQQAIDWFHDYGQSLHPEDRHRYCTKLAARADELGLDPGDDIRKYGSNTYAPDGEIKVAIATRMQFWRDGQCERSMLEQLMEKRASTPPDVWCEALNQFDRLTGLNHRWDEAIYDPWYSTYGVKTAQWSFESQGERINEKQLLETVKGNYQVLRSKFSEELADELRRDPVKIFSSLPLDAKRIIIRLANDPQPSPHMVMA